MSEVRVYQDKAGEWRWHRLANGHIVSESGEGYGTASPTSARAAAGKWSGEVPENIRIVRPEDQED